MKLFFLIVLQSVFILSGRAQLKDEFPRDWQKIFNGADLSGWSMKTQGFPAGEDFRKTFRVTDGMLTADFDDYEKFQSRYSVLYFDEELYYYRLRFEFHFAGDQVSGGFKENDKRFAVMIHAQPLNTLSLGQAIPVGLEINLLGDTEHVKNRSTGTLCTPGTSVKYIDGFEVGTRCLESNRKSSPDDEWVKFEVHVYGDSLIRHYINGSLALEYAKPQIAEASKFKDLFLGEWGVNKINQALKSGYIALLVESQSVEFRNIELLNLRGCRNPQCSDYRRFHKKEFPGDCECVKRKLR